MHPESPLKDENSAVTPILVTSFNIKKELSSRSNDSNEENKWRLSRLPTSSFNRDNSIDSSVKSNDISNREIERYSENSINNNQSKVDRDIDEQNYLSIQNVLTNKSNSKAISNKWKSRNSFGSHFVLRPSFENVWVEEQLLIKYCWPTKSMYSNLFSVAKELHNSMSKEASTNKTTNYTQLRKIKIQNLNTTKSPSQNNVICL